MKAALRECIARLSGKVAASAIADDTPIIERRIITSLQVMDLILELESLKGSPIEVERLKPGVFKDIDAIIAAFWGPGEGAIGGAGTGAGEADAGLGSGAGPGRAGGNGEA